MNIEDIISKCPQTARSDSFNFTLREIEKRFGLNPIEIVCTGSIRQLNDSGDGHGDLVFSVFAQETNSNISIVELNQDHINIAIEVIRRAEIRLPNYTCGDSIDYLKAFQRKINMLYLDSYDTDSNKNCCIHQVLECQSAIDKLSDKALVLLDDVGYEFKGGKAEYSSSYLLANGFELLRLGNNQALFGRI